MKLFDGWEMHVRSFSRRWVKPDDNIGRHAVNGWVNLRVRRNGDARSNKGKNVYYLGWNGGRFAKSDYLKDLRKRESILEKRLVNELKHISSGF